MSYIGKEPQTGAYSMLDALTASATASYSLTLDSVAFVPESANHLLVSLNGSIQKAGSSYTCSGSTLTFSSALTSSDSIDFVLALGNVLDIGTPSDATVTNAKTNFVSTSSSAGLDIKGDGTTDGTLRLLCSQGTHGVKIASPAHSAGQSYTLTLPTGNVTADKFLKVASVSGSGTTATGQLSFADAGGTINTPYAARMYGSASQSIANTTHVALDFASEVFDKGGIADVSTDRMTVPSDGAGLWWMSAAVQVNNFRAQRNILNFFINGSTTAGVSTGDNFENGKWDDSGHYSTSTGAVLFNLSAGDYVTAHFYQNGGGTEQVINRNFTAWYLGPSS